MKPEEVPQELLEILDLRAGKKHGRTGPVVACLAEILARYAEMNERERYEDLLASIALYIDWRYVTRQLTTEQKDLFADAIGRHAFRIHGPGGEDPDPEMSGSPSYASRWWKDGP